MKKYPLLLVLAIAGIVAVSFNWKQPKANNNSDIIELFDGEYTVDAGASTVKWTGKKITYDHYGTIDIATGKITVTDSKVAGGEFTLDMNSIKNDDIEDKKKNGRLVGHLKSADFFNVEEHATSSFKITSVKEQKSDEGNYAITGNLTIKGTTQEINFPANITVDGDKLTASAKMTFDRSKFDVRYGSGSFFENLGDKIIYDDIEMEVELVANK